LISPRFLRYFTGILIISAVFYFYIFSITKKTEKIKQVKKIEIVEKIIIGSDEFFGENAVYKNGEGSFEISSETKTISVTPKEDFFVSISIQKNLIKDQKLETLKLSFSYNFIKSGNNNPHKEAGAAIVLISESGYKSIYISYPECSTTGEWKDCALTIKNPGKSKLAILRFGATSFYKTVSFRNIELKSVENLSVM